MIGTFIISTLKIALIVVLATAAGTIWLEVDK
jgi:hypothetical protein